MSEPFVGEIRYVGFNFAPRGWALCQGQLLAISSNTALFSLIGTTFGGDGRSTFGLPDLRGRLPKGVGSGPGLGHCSWGQRGGAEDIVLAIPHLPSHNHQVNCHGAPGSGNETNNPTNAYPGDANTGNTMPYDTRPNSMMNSGMIGNTGNNIPFSIKNPYLGLYAIIALVGLYPSRS